jgi:hypothetical protein
VTPHTKPIEDILAGVEKRQFNLYLWKWRKKQENVRIMKNSSKPRGNLTRAETKALRKLKKNTELTILPADKCNEAVFLNTVD